MSHFSLQKNKEQRRRRTRVTRSSGVIDPGAFPGGRRAGPHAYTRQLVMQQIPKDTIFPPIPIAASLASVAAVGALSTCAVVAALLKHRRNGIYSIIIQLCVADILLSVTLVPEIWSYNAQTWNFGASACTIYQGLRVFTSTATHYLVAVLVLHTLATMNMEQKTQQRRIKRGGRDDDEIRSSCHSLVADSETSTPPRSMHVDYRFIATQLPATLPTIFIWILSASLSIPEFVLSIIVYTDKCVVCCLDSTHRFNIYSMLAVFTLFIPFFIMGTTAVLVLIKLKCKKKLDMFENTETTAALQLSLWLIFSHGLLCAPRTIVDIYGVYSTSFSGSESSSIIYHSPLGETAAMNMGVSSLCFLSVIVRPIIYIVTLPQLRKQLTIGSRERNDV